MNEDFPDPEPPSYRYPVYDLAGTLECERCGALVQETEVHTEWHMGLTEAIHSIIDNILPLLFAVAGERDD
jgi:hypothetical protein